MHDRFTTQVYEHICVGRLSCLKDLLVPSTYSIPWVQFWCSWYSGILYSPQFFFDLRCYYYKHSPWVSEHLSCLLWIGMDSPHFLPWSKFLPFLCCLAARYRCCFFLYHCTYYWLQFFCVFSCIWSFCLSISCCGVTDFFFFFLSFYYCTNIIGSFCGFSMQMIIWVLDYFAVGWVDM